jgi:hypothetical protein
MSWKQAETHIHNYVDAISTKKPFHAQNAIKKEKTNPQGDTEEGRNESETHTREYRLQ